MFIPFLVLELAIQGIYRIIHYSDIIAHLDFRCWWKSIHQNLLH